MKRTIILCGLILFVFGCNEPLQEEPVPDLKSGKRVERTILFHRSVGTMEVVNSDACQDYNLQMLILGEGNATFLGHYTVKNTCCLDDNMQAISPIMGELTAANGDMIYTMVMEAPWVEDGMPHYRYTLLPELCTGRFEGATGYIVMYGVIDYGNMVWDLKGEGKITF